MPPFPALGAVSVLVFVVLASAVATFAAIPPMMPLLRRYALARPNARSSHKAPTPQGGGMAVIGVCAVGLALVLAFAPGMPDAERLSLSVLLAGTLVLAVLGGVDDLRPLPALPRLLVQLASVAAVVWSLPSGERLLPDFVPVVAERAVLTVALLWFVNLTNFMDGLDWITVAGFAPLSLALAMLAAAGAAGVAAGLIGALLLGGLLGFAPFNRPTARLFLGDVGSLPLGLLAGYALIRLGGEGHLVPAIILPLAMVTDATLTLLRRMAAGERFWDAHRSHFYQRATANGLGVMDVVTRAALVNLTLAATAGILVLVPTPARLALGCVVAVASVAALLSDFNRPRANS